MNILSLSIVKHTSTHSHALAIVFAEFVANRHEPRGSDFEP